MVPDAALCRLYRRAGRTIYPSLYEGFGFPVLDSLRHGTPVLTSQNSSLREFTVPGVTFFDPCDAATLDAAWVASQARRRPGPGRTGTRVFLGSRGRASARVDPDASAGLDARIPRPGRDAA